MTLYHATSNYLCFCTIWQNGETRKSHFSLKYCISALPEFNYSCSLISSVFFESGLILTLLYDSLNLVIDALSSGLFGGAWFKRKEVESAAAVGLLHAQCISTNALSS